MSILIIKSGTTEIEGATIKGDFTYFSATTKGLGATIDTGFWSGVDPTCDGYTVYKIGGQNGWAAMVATGREQLNEYLIAFGAPYVTVDENITWATNTNNMFIHSGSTGPCLTLTPTPTTTQTQTPTNTPTPTPTPTTVPLSPMIITINIPNSGDTFGLPYSNIGTYSGTINWGDGSSSVNSYANRTHTYSTSGNYDVTITGLATEFSFGTYGGSNLQLVDVKQWGNIGINSYDSSFYDCNNLTGISATDYPILSGNISGMFESCELLGTTATNISNWNTENVTNMGSMFANNTNFNSDVSSWNVSNVTNMGSMFTNTNFNYSLNSWNVSNVTNMNAMFSITPFNSDISSWNTSNVTIMNSMFKQASEFNQNISTWNVSGVTDMQSMFESADAFNQNINTWDVSSVTNMQNMFASANAFNQNINTWDVSSVTNMQGMFGGAYVFNQNIGTWNVSSVTNMQGMFGGASVFNQNISTWNVSSVTNMINMFVNASSFNQDLSGWCVTNIPTTPTNFSLFATAWSLPKPVWGTCP
jgi:surface protein